MANVMISYSRRNRDVALRVDRSLQDAGKEVWIDREIEPAADWWDRITKAIDECSSVVFLLSPDSLESDVCTQEVDYALNDGKRIIPVVIVEPGDTPVPPALAARNYVFLREGDDWDDGLRKIVSAIDTDLAWADYHGEILLRAISWDDADRPNAALLRGNELSKAEQEFAKPRDVLQSQPTALQLQFLQAGRVAASKRLRRLIGVGTVALIAIAGLAVVSLILRSQAATERDRANEEAAISRSGELAARSAATNDPYEAAVLAVESDQGRSTTASRSALAGAATRLDVLPATRRFPRLTGHADFVWAVDVSVRADRIISVGRNGEVIAADLSTGDQIDASYSIDVEPSAIEFSPDGTLVAIVDFGRSLHVLRSDDLEPVNEPGQLEHGGDSIRWDPSGASLSIVGRELLTTDWSIETWTATDITEFEPVDDLWTAAFSPDGQLVAGGTVGGDVVLWDAETGALLSAPIPVHDGIIYRLDWSADGVRVATSSLDRTIRVTDVGSESVVAELIGHQEGILWVEWSPQGDRLVSTGFDGSVRIWDAVTLAQQGDALVAHSNSTSMVRWADDGDVIASASDDRSVLVWDARGPETGSKMVFDEFNAMSWSGNSFWAARQSGAIARYANDGAELATVEVSDVPIVAIDVDPSGDRLATLDGFGRLDALDDAGAVIDSIDLGASFDPNDDVDRVWPGDVAWSPDGTRLAVALDSGVWVWRPGGEPQQLSIPTDGFVFALAWSPDGSVLTAGGDGNMVHIWDPVTDTAVVGPLEYHIDLVFDLAFSADGSTLASASKDKTVRLWSTDSWEPIGTELRGHRGWVLNVEWSPDGTVVATSSPDRTIRFWETATGSSLGIPLEGYEGFVLALAWHESGDWLAAGDDAGRLTVYAPLAQTGMCAQAVRGLGAIDLEAIDVGAERTCSVDRQPTDGTALPTVRAIDG